jgi:DNA-binding Xre family transcriptional regulator
MARVKARIRLKEVAKEKHMSMGKLSRESDVAYNTIKRIYDDPKYSPTANTLARLAVALQVSVGDLVEIVSEE